MIYLLDGRFTKFDFPVGEMQVRVDSVPLGLVIEWEFERNEEVLELLLLVDALRRVSTRPISLKMPYVPFGRQDRVAVRGEAFSLKVFCDLVNGCGFDRVYVDDPHSDVTTALLNNVVVREQHDIMEPFAVLHAPNVTLICPDGGALKKIHKLATRLAGDDRFVRVIECSKRRNVLDGRVTGVIVHAESLKGVDCVIVDDICDGGRTFIEIAKELRAKGAGRITLMVTHGFFTKGLEVFDGLIDEIYTRKGMVKH